jgi:hypothetical protein
MDYTKMTIEEYKEFQELEKQMVYAEKMLKDISRR